MTEDLNTVCYGFCEHCQTEHSLDTGGVAYTKALWLMEQLEQKNNIDLFSNKTPEPKWSTESLFGQARGKMFGILECTTEEQKTVYLYAFSGQFACSWELEGWAPPLFDAAAFEDLNGYNEKRIKKMSTHIKDIEQRQQGKSSLSILKAKRKILSQQLMKNIHKLYRLHNFRNKCYHLREAFSGKEGIPTGTGDCCAPKLLNYAAQNHLTPISIAEFYWGRQNKSATKQHGCFYSSCTNKCIPILGFLLCGATTPFVNKRK